MGDILVLGMGRSGEAVARYCAALIGSQVESVTVVDSANDEKLRARASELEEIGVRVFLGVESAQGGGFDLAIASPGIPPSSPLMKSARASAREVISEIEFAFRHSSQPWVAITGTNGKTTTTALTAHLLNTGGIPARAVGNIGLPAIGALASHAGEVLVAEVSSFQLALTSRFRPRVAVLLNITPDHLDWHGSFQAYVADKTKIFDNLGVDDVAVIDVDDEGSAPFAEALMERGVRVVRVSRGRVLRGGASAASGRLALDAPAGPMELVAVDELRIRGPHNVSNALAAAAAAHALGVRGADLAEGLTTFAPIEHRLEPVGEALGAEWFNDSKATNPDAVFKALDAFDDRPVVLMLGGRNKGSDFRSLALAAARRARHVVVFGEAAGEIEDAFHGTGAHVTRVQTLLNAVSEAARHAQSGDAVVLSPACASFDEFRDYEERGRVFKALVAALERGELS